MFLPAAQAGRCGRSPAQSRAHAVTPEVKIPTLKCPSQFRRQARPDLVIATLFTLTDESGVLRSARARRSVAHGTGSQLCGGAGCRWRTGRPVEESGPHLPADGRNRTGAVTVGRRVAAIAVLFVCVWAAFCG